MQLHRGYALEALSTLDDRPQYESGGQLSGSQRRSAHVSFQDCTGPQIETGEIFFRATGKKFVAYGLM